MRYSSLAILSFIAMPVAIFLGLEMRRDVGGTVRLYFQDWWMPVCMTLLAVGLLRSVFRFGNRGNRDRSKH